MNKIIIEFDGDAIQIQGSNEGPWFDMGLLIEAIGVLMGQERKGNYQYAKTKGIITKGQLTDYVIDYIKRVADDYDGVDIKFETDEEKLHNE